MSCAGVPEGYTSWGGHDWSPVGELREGRNNDWSCGHCGTVVSVRWVTGCPEYPPTLSSILVGVDLVDTGAKCLADLRDCGEVVAHMVHSA